MARKTTKWSVAIFAFGLALLSTGAFLQTTATPAGTMDCGCGGQTQCVTKRGAVASGMALIASGAFFCLSAPLSLTVQRQRRTA